MNNVGKLNGTEPAHSYAISEMNGTAAIDTTIATEHTISASLKRHGKRLVQCFVFSKIDIVIYRLVSETLKEAFVTCCINWRPQGDSNPCCRDENPVS